MGRALIVLALLLVPQDEASLADLIERLDANSIDERQDAHLALVKTGARALPLLRKALKDPPSLEFRDRVAAAIDEIEFEEKIKALPPESLRVGVGGIRLINKNPLELVFSLNFKIDVHLRLADRPRFTLSSVTDHQGRAMEASPYAGQYDMTWYSDRRGTCIIRQVPPYSWTAKGTRLGTIKGSMTCSFPASEREVVLAAAQGTTGTAGLFEIEVVKSSRSGIELRFRRGEAESNLISELLCRIDAKSVVAVDTHGDTVKSKSVTGTGHMFIVTQIEDHTIYDAVGDRILMEFEGDRELKEIRFKFVDVVREREFPFEIKVDPR